MVIFNGSISAQATVGETVTITVTRPDNTVDTWTTVTLADKTFTLTKEYLVAGNYNAKAHVDADAIYDVWDSSIVPFVIGLTPRTGTFTVRLA